MIRVLVVDDQGIVRAGLRRILPAPEDLEIVGEAADGGPGSRPRRSLEHPDVVLMDTG